MDLQLKGKTAFVSGSSQGIGYAIAKQLLQEGATVIINSLTRAEVDQAVTKLITEVSGASVSGIAADFTKADEVNALVTQLESKDIDILVNNAGIYEQKRFEDITDESWHRFFEVNVMSGVRLARGLFPKMLAKNWGRVIFITSEAAVNVPENMIHYSTSKAAIHAVSRGLAELTKGTAVTVNTIMPGPTASEGIIRFVEQLAQDKGVSYQEAEAYFFKTERPSSLLQRFASVDEVANLVAYLASPRSAATDGAALRVDGGVVKTIL